MGKALIKVAIGAAIVGAAFLTGGASLIPSFSLAATGTATAAFLTTTTLGGLALAAGATTILGGLSQTLAKTPKTSLATLDRLNASLVPGAPRKQVFGYTAMATDIRYLESDP